MYTFRVNVRRIIILVSLVFQAIVVLYLLNERTKSNKDTNEKVTFVENYSKDYYAKNLTTYHTENSIIYLRNVKVSHSFIDFNSSLCFINGTDLAEMKRSKNPNWECKCKEGWHGNDCGKPEAVWRAILTSKKPLKIQGPRVFQRRIIYVFRVDKTLVKIIDIRIHELFDAVDLFVLYEYEDFSQNTFYEEKIKLLKKTFQQKILYVKLKSPELKNVWNKINKIVQNVNSEDMILTTNDGGIPHKNSLLFMKHYDSWQGLIQFRMRYSVFGFFWRHPVKTIIVNGATTVKYFNELFNNNLDTLQNYKRNKGLVLGDLNHYGGWYCEFCATPENIIQYLNKNGQFAVKWNTSSVKKIDTDYIEDLIENGLYLDGKLGLEKARKYFDNYFAPDYVNNNNWKFDYLLANIYSKMDYYEA